MGVLNVTSDSFSDGGLDVDSTAATARALELWHAGADIIDIGGESTRPGADPVDALAEMPADSFHSEIRLPQSASFLPVHWAGIYWRMQQ